MRIGEPAKDKVHFADTAMPASKKKTTATRIQPLARQVRPCGHRMSPTPKTRTGPGVVYIKASCRNVSRPFAQGCIAPKFRTSQHVLMRPLALSPLFASLRSLTGVGPKLEKLYARLLDREAPRVVDLLFHMPSGVIDRRARPK